MFKIAEKLIKKSPFLLENTKKLITKYSFLDIRRFRHEPYLEPAYHELRAFYTNRQEYNNEIFKELGEYSDHYSQWYKSGGFGDNLKNSRLWLLKETSLPDFRGSCLDVGSGDGFWSWILSEWYNVTGIEPSPGGVELSNAILKRLPQTIQRRTDFILGDALEVNDKYDVVFCRGPSFFNYPIYKPFTHEILDKDRARLRKIWKEIYSKKEFETKIAAYPPQLPIEKFIYADKWRDYLVKMLSITNKLFIFISATRKEYYGLFVGGSYYHDPKEIQLLFSEYGSSNVRMDSSNSYIVGEIYR